MKSPTKLWKVVIEISHARSDGNGESGRETKLTAQYMQVKYSPTTQIQEEQK